MHKIIFIGTTTLGIPTLKFIKDEYKLPLIITRPDKPAGRKKIPAPSPVKVWAEENNISIAQPEKINDIGNRLQEITPDLILVIAYGRIIPQEILDIPKFKSLNIHPSLLPKYRGPSPIKTALLNGDTETGTTLMQIDSEMDHGPILAQKSMAISDTDDSPSLLAKLAELSAQLIVDTLPDFLAGKIKPYEQDHTKASFTTMISTKDAKIDWSDNAQVTLNRIRAYSDEPGAWTTFDGNNVKIVKGTLLKDTSVELPGKLYRHEGQLAVKCRDNSLILDKVIPAGKKPMSGKDFINGLKNLETKIFI